MALPKLNYARFDYDEPTVPTWPSPRRLLIGILIWIAVMAPLVYSLIRLVLPWLDSLHPHNRGVL